MVYVSALAKKGNYEEESSTGTLYRITERNKEARNDRGKDEKKLSQLENMAYTSLIYQ